MSKFSRRDFIIKTGSTAAVFACIPSKLPANGRSRTQMNMHGLIGKITVKSGRRDELISILIEGVANMPGCLSYVVARDPAAEDTIWVTEVWDSRESHEKSLSYPSVKEAMAEGRSLITGFSHRIETVPVGGHGLPTESEE